MELSTEQTKTAKKTKKVKKATTETVETPAIEEQVIESVKEDLKVSAAVDTTATDEDNAASSDEQQDTTESVDVTIEILARMKTISENLSEIVKHSVKNLSVDKEFLTEFRNIRKKIDKFDSNVTDLLVVESIASLKKKDAKKMKSKSTTKKPSHVTTPSETYDFILNFMKLPLTSNNAEGVSEKTKVSKADIMGRICDYVRDNKLQLETDKKTFAITGDLDGLFSKIKENMKQRGKLTPEIEASKEVKYTQLMTFLTHCFPEKPKK